MAHSVEGRFPFLDYRVVEFCNRLPADFKQRGLNEKWLLRRLARRYSAEIASAPNVPTGRPSYVPSLAADRRRYVDELLSPDHLRRTEYFDPATVGGLVRKARSGSPLSEVDEMALVGILSTQLVDHLFVRGKGRPNPPVFDAPLKLADRIATGWAEGMLTLRRQGGQLDLLRSFDPEAEVNRLADRLRADLSTPLTAVAQSSASAGSGLRRRACVVRPCPRASRVLAVLLPERESSPESAALASAWAEQLGVESCSRTSPRRWRVQEGTLVG